MYKVKYYLIKAHLKIRTKEAATTTGAASTNDIIFPKSILIDNEIDEETNNTDADVASSFIMNKMLDWLEKTPTTNNKPQQNSPTKAAFSQQPQEDVQELEEEQEVQEVEMFGESDAYDPVTLINSIKEESETALALKWTNHSADGNGNDGENTPTLDTTTTTTNTLLELNMDELLRLTTSASFFYNQQRLNACASLGSSGVSHTLDNHFLVHLLAINKNENVFRVKQIHDYYGGCFICGKQVDFNMKHYQVRLHTKTEGNFNVPSGPSY